METASQIDALKGTIRDQENLIHRLQSQAASENLALNANALTANARVPQLEHQIKDLQEQLKISRKKTEDSEVLKEKLHSMQIAASQAHRVEQELSRVKVENEALRRERASWEGFLAGLPGLESPEEIARNLSQMQQQNLALIDANGTLSAEVKRLSLRLEERDKEVQQLAEKLVSAQDTANDAQRSLDYANTRLRESERRSKSFEDILKSYRMEEALPMNNFDAGKAAQLRELERQLAEKDKTITTWEAEAECLRASAKQMEKEIDRLLEERQTLHNRLGRGDYNPAGTKILHFAFTPEMMKQEQQTQVEASELRQRVAALQEELALLKSSLAVAAAEVSAGPSSILAPSSSALLEAQQKYEQMSGELKTLRLETALLKEQLQEKEYSNKRFTEVCMSRVKEFKDTCYQLFGWKIDFDDQSGRRYRLQSMFSRSAEEYLLFQYSKKQLMLYETEFSKAIDPSISDFLTQYGSIPSFLSSLTLALFERSRRK